MQSMSMLVIVIWLNLITYATSQFEGNGCGCGDETWHPAAGYRDDAYCYTFVKEKATFDQAMQKCEELGGMLAGVDYIGEPYVLTKYMYDTTTKKAWIGVSDRDTEGIFLNTDGSPFSYVFFNQWDPTKPVRDSGWHGNCVILTRKRDAPLSANTLKWKTVSCTESYSYFCKKPIEENWQNCLGVSTEATPTDMTTAATDEDNCTIVKPRRYDLTYLGDDCYFRGWADVSGQGASNDYCRIVAGGGQREYLSCALAGTQGESQFNYNSANTSETMMDVGYKDTWYMKDEDGDGKDDYCRCVGEPPETGIACLKAGDDGFTYNFLPYGLDTHRNCHNTKINPYLGSILLNGKEGRVYYQLYPVDPETRRQSRPGGLLPILTDKRGSKDRTDHGSRRPSRQRGQKEGMK